MFGSLLFLLAQITEVRRNHHHSSRAGRAIEGFSRGGRGSTCLAMKFPEMFVSRVNPAKPDEYPNNYLGKDKARHIHNDSHLLLAKNVAQLKGKLRI